jgi:hypothetical protein
VTNPAFWDEQIASFLRTRDRLEGWSGPRRSTSWSSAWATASRRRCSSTRLRPRVPSTAATALRRLRYLMADYSPRVLEIARARVAEYGDQVEGLELDFRKPIHGLSHLRCEVLFAHTCNLYDNLPTDDSCTSATAPTSRWCVRASRPGRPLRSRCASACLSTSWSAASRRSCAGPEVMGEVALGVQLWSAVSDAVHLEEIYEEIPSPAAMRVAPVSASRSHSGPSAAADSEHASPDRASDASRIATACLISCAPSSPAPV